MKMVKNLVVGFCLLATSALAMAQEKVVVLDMQAAMMGTELAQKTVEGLQKDAEFTALRAKLEGLVADINALQDKAEKESMTWSEEQVSDHRKRVEYLHADYELATKKLQSEQQQVLQRVQQQLSPRIPPALEQLVKDQNIGLIINAQSVFHATAEYDITDDLIKQLNKAK